MTDRVAALATVPLPAALADRHGLPGEVLRLHRAWPRGADHLLLEYVTADGRRVAGQWRADRAVLARVTAATADRARHPDDVALLADRGVLLQAAGADRRLPALVRLAARRGAEVLVHRPERRGVVRFGRGDGARYAKVVRPDRVDGLVARAEDVAVALGRPAGVTRPVRTAAPDLVDRHAGVLLAPALAGTALHDGLADPRGATAWWAAGEALRRLHDLAPPAGCGVHDAAAEADVVATWVAHLRAHRPAEAPAVTAAAGAAAAGLAGGASGRSAVVHRDLHDKNVLVATDGAVGLLDLDTLAVGEPAVDLANALVHLELRVLQGRCAPSGAAARAAALLAGYDPAPDVRERLPAYAAATRVRLACVYAFRPGTDARPLLADVSRPPGALAATA